MRRRGFTLIEILVVLAIIAILAAILFPAFKRAREGGHQANCASNLKQIYLAVKLYKDDEARYPGSLAFLLPQQLVSDPSNLSDANSTPPVVAGVPNVSASGHLKTIGVLACPDDENADVGYPRSSYGDISIDLTKGSDPRDATPNSPDPGRYVWNYLGYDQNGWAYRLNDPTGTKPNYLWPISPGSTLSPLLVNKDLPYDLATNPIKRSLSNRYAPEDTVITHCVYHRTSTSNLVENWKLHNPSYDQCSTTPSLAGCSDRLGARDIIIRLDGRSEAVDVSSFDHVSAGLSTWQTQSFK